MTRVLCSVLLLLACESETNQLRGDAGPQRPRFPVETDAGAQLDASEPGDATEPRDPCPTPSAPEVLLTLSDTIAAIAPFGEHVYFTAAPVEPPNPGRSWVGRVPITGGSAEVLASDESGAASIAADEEGVYWANQGEDPAHPLSARIRMLPSTGGPPQTVFPRSADLLVLGGGQLYLWSRNERAERVLLRAELPLGPSSTSTLVATVAPAFEVEYVPYLLAGGRAAYWTEHRPGEGPDPTRTSFFGVAHDERLPRVLIEFGERTYATTDETFVYFRGAGRGGLWRQDLSTSAREQIAEPDQFRVPAVVSILAAIITDGDFVYVASAGPGSTFIFRVSLASRQVCLIVEDVGHGPAEVVDFWVQPTLLGGHLYYRRSPNQIARVPR